MANNTAQQTLRALRASDRPMTAIALSVALDVGPDRVTRALWALRAAGLAESRHTSNMVLWSATTDAAVYCPKCGNDTGTGDAVCETCDLDRPEAHK
jgi:DNA-binding transcriptional ArsR family regulator